MSKKPLPTDAEIAILGVLWRAGPSTVRGVHEALEPLQGTGYTTVLKLMQIMAQKGLVARDERQRSHVYRALVREDETQRRMAAELAQKAFAGSASQLAMRALEAAPASRQELDAVRALLDALEA